MNKKQFSFVAVGIPSLFLIFSVLCLVIFALLSLGTSQSDLRESQLSMEQTTAYYDACTDASDLCTQIYDYLLEAYSHSSGEKAYFSTIQDISSTIPEVFWDEQTNQISFDKIISDDQKLHVVLKVSYPRSPQDAPCALLSWETSVYSQWEPDTKQKLLFS